jgi:hypothetical protein
MSKRDSHDWIASAVELRATAAIANDMTIKAV